MDIRIEKKKGIRALFTKKGIPYLAGALFLVFVLWLLLRDNSSTLRVDARTISVGQVVSGEFKMCIRDRRNTAHYGRLSEQEREGHP